MRETDIVQVHSDLFAGLSPSLSLALPLTYTHTYVHITVTKCCIWRDKKDDSNDEMNTKKKCSKRNEFNVFAHPAEVIIVHNVSSPVCILVVKSKFQFEAC